MVRPVDRTVTSGAEHGEVICDEFSFSAFLHLGPRHEVVQLKPASPNWLVFRRNGIITGFTAKSLLMDKATGGAATFPPFMCPAVPVTDVRG